MVQILTANRRLWFLIRTSNSNQSIWLNLFLWAFSSSSIWISCVLFIISLLSPLNRTNAIWNLFQLDPNGFRLINFSLSTQTKIERRIEPNSAKLLIENKNKRKKILEIQKTEMNWLSWVNYIIKNRVILSLWNNNNNVAIINLVARNKRKLKLLRESMKWKMKFSKIKIFTWIQSNSYSFFFSKTHQIGTKYYFYPNFNWFWSNTFPPLSHTMFFFGSFSEFSAIFVEESRDRDFILSWCWWTKKNWLYKKKKMMDSIDWLRFLSIVHGPNLFLLVVVVFISPSSSVESLLLCCYFSSEFNLIQSISPIFLSLVFFKYLYPILGLDIPCFYSLDILAHISHFRVWEEKVWLMKMFFTLVFR